MSPLLGNSRLRTPLLLVVAVAVAMAFFLPSCSQGPRPNILLITVDTLRPDHLGYDGGRAGVSPTIDALAKTGTVYRNAYSVCGWTLPAMATIMTGKYPRGHGKVSWYAAIDTNVTTMAQALKSRGYSTGAFVSHLVLRRNSGLAPGFDIYDDSVLDVGHPHKVSTAVDLTDLTIDFINRTESPYFVWIHYFDPHFEYLVHERYARFGNGTTDRYDQEIAATDEQIARLIQAVNARGEIDDTVIMFTSDHGEEFGEHGGEFHRTLYDEVLRVPLVIRVPGREAAADDRPVEQIDILPTVYGLLGLDTEGLEGSDLLAPAPAGERMLYAERQFPPLWSQHSVRTDRYKLIIVEEVDTTMISRQLVPSLPKIRRDVRNVSPGIYLYNLIHDPGERTNIYREDHAEGRALLVNLVEFMETGSTADAPKIEVDEETLDKLRSLGYIQ